MVRSPHWLHFLPELPCRFVVSTGAVSPSMVHATFNLDGTFTLYTPVSPGVCYISDGFCLFAFVHSRVAAAARSDFYSVFNVIFVFSVHINKSFLIFLAAWLRHAFHYEHVEALP